MLITVRRLLGIEPLVSFRRRDRHHFGESVGLPVEEDVSAVDAIDLRVPSVVVSRTDVEPAVVDPVRPPQSNLRAPGEMWHPTVGRASFDADSTDTTFGHPRLDEERLSWRDVRDEPALPLSPIAPAAGDAGHGEATRDTWDQLADGTAPRARYGLGPADDLYAAGAERLAEVEAERSRSRPRRPHRPARGSLFGPSGDGGGRGRP